MPGQIPTPIQSIAFVALFFAWSIGLGVPTNIARADECLAAPNSPAPAGSHWYFQTDRAKQRKCWFLRAKDQSAQQPAAQTQSEAAAATDTTAELPATASVGTPMSISPADSTLKQQPAPKSSATTKNPAEAPSPQTSTQSPVPAPGVGVGAPTNIASADDCVSAPNSPAPEGKHWFYRTDRATQRKCWYLRAKDQPTQRTDAQAPSAAPATPSAFENATASAGVPMSKSPADSAPSLKPQPAQAKQSAPKGGTPSLSPAEPASQTSAPAAGPAPVAASVPPYPSAGATASAPQPNTRADLLPPTVDSRVPDDTARTTGGGASTANAAGMATSVTGALIQMSLIVLLALGVAGLLYRVVTAVARRRQIIVDHPKSDLVDHQNPHNWRDNQQQHESIDRREQSMQDLRSSPLSVANDRDAQQQHRPVERDQLDDSRRSPILGENYVSGEWPNNTCHTKRASQFTESNEHDDTLAQLRRDLDQLLQPKPPDDQQQYRSIDERDHFIDNLHRSPISGANDYEAGPNPANDELPINARRASQITSEVSEREDRLAQLRRDLDSLLQTPKRA
jgi:hypothetical protein